MSNYPVGRPPRSADPQSKLRLAALTAVIAGVVLLAAAAFVLSYSGIHQLALQAGVSPNLAKLYPVIFDAMLVVAGAAALALRGAGWWSRFYAWACLIVLLAAVAFGDAVHATNTALPERASRAVVAITPWVLLLLAFGLLLTMLRHFRKARATVVARQEARAVAAGAASTSGQAAEANGTAASRSAVTWAAAGAAGTAAGTEGRALPQPLSALDMLLGPRAAQAPAIEAPFDAEDTGIDDDASQGDPVSYGEETGYVHPDSYRDEGEYSPHGDSGGPGGYPGAGSPGQDEPAGDGAAVPRQGTAAANGEGDDPADAAAQPAQPEQPAQPGQPAQPEQPGQADQPAQPEQADQADQPGQADQAGQPGSEAQPGQAEAAADGTPAGEQAKDDTGAEPAAAQSQGLERVRSTPTRPEE